MAPRKNAARSTFGSLVARAARQWRRAADLRLQPFALTEATWLPLVHIARAPQSPRQKDLAASMSLDGSSVVRLLDNLEAAGLIQRRHRVAATGHRNQLLCPGPLGRMSCREHRAAGTRPCRASLGEAPACANAPER